METLILIIAAVTRRQYNKIINPIESANCGLTGYPQWKISFLVYSKDEERKHKYSIDLYGNQSMRARDFDFLTTVFKF